MKKIVILATVIVSGMALSLHAEEGEKGKGKGKGGGMDPGKRAEMMIEKLDTDGSGTISKAEFEASPMAGKMKGKEGMLDKVFAGRDANGDGELDKKELSKPMKGKGKGPGDEGGKGKGKKEKEKDAE